MAKKTNQEISEPIFEKNKDLKEVYITSDGFAFITKNAAQLHAQTSGKKGITVETVLKAGEAKKTPKENKEPIKLKALKLEELKALALQKGLRPDYNATKVEIIKAIEDLEQIKIKE